MITRLIGNAILRAAHLAHYTDDASAAAIGATGGVIASIIVGIILHVVEDHWFIRLCSGVLASTLTGTIGCAILLHNHVDLGPIDVLHATRAGALGGAIIGPAMSFAVPLIFTLLFIILTPIWLVMMSGLKWVSAHSSETWDGRTYEGPTWCCFGTCGRDSEVNEEIEILQRV